MDPGSSSSSSIDFHEPILQDLRQDMQYDEAFPALAPNPSGQNSGPTSGLSSPGNSSKWIQKMRVGSDVTCVFNIPYEERSDRIHGDRFGEMDSLKACAEITKQTHAHIEMSSSAKDQSLTFLITGKQLDVQYAKREILSRFQTQAQVTINIPKEHHRFLLGPKGASLAELEKSTATKITIPRPNDDSSNITISGTREGIEKAVHEIRLISDKQSKQASEKINLPKKFHAFISGPFNNRLKKLEDENKVKINIPPTTVMKDDIHIIGDKEGVARVVNIINMEHNEYKQYKPVSVEVAKNQHKYVIGPRRNNMYEILERTGVSVEMPPLDSPSETITLRGPSESLGTALTLVYEKANSVTTKYIDAPDWIHKYIVGKRGSNIQRITSNYAKEAHVEIKDNQIVIEGPTEEVIPLTAELQACVRELLDNKTLKEIEIDPMYHKYIIGKKGASLNRLREETGVIISVTDPSSRIIKLEGPKAGVELAAERLLEQVAKLENEKEKDLNIEHRFHGNLIGTKGEKIREIRDMFNQVQINFPPPSDKRDIVTIRGPREDVEKCSRHINALYKEMLENAYQIKVPIFPQTYRLVIGKANIRQLREDLGVRIDLPPMIEDRKKTEAEIIMITGKKENCEKVKEKILSIQNGLANVVKIDVMIPNKFHNTLIGYGGKMVQSISEDCGGVQIKFPDSKTKSDRISILGPKENVEKAKNMLLEISREKEQNSFTDTLEANAQQHKLFTGKNYSTIRRIRDATGVRVMLPNEYDSNQNLITLIGKKEGVQQAKKQLQDMFKELEQTTEIEMDVDPQYHYHFLSRGAGVIRQIQDELGVQISFPKLRSNSHRVFVKGPVDCVEAARKKIETIVDDLIQRVTVDVVIEQKHHRTIMGTKGAKVQQIESDYNVDIKFPDRQEDYGNSIPENGNGGVRPFDIITVSGRKENCERAKEALLAQVPVRLEVDIPFDMHRFIIGSKGKDVRDLMHNFDVNITVPPQEHHSDVIVITGSPKNVTAARVALLEKKEELEEQKRMQDLKSYTVTVKVDPEYHPKLIGKRGATISEIRDKYDVNIQLPRRDDVESDTIKITGFEEKANAARDEILAVVNKFIFTIKEEVELDHRVHSRIIGYRGSKIREIMSKYNVDVRFPRGSDENPDLVIIAGNDEGDVLDARDFLLNQEEEYLQDVKENEYMQQYIRDSRQDQRNSSTEKKSNGFVVTGAPWEQPPDTQSNEEFPSMGNGVSNSHPVNSAWGARKHF